jgi:FtsP/CotA-like multicopper oxidase with cupredoxin domain
VALIEVGWRSISGPLTPLPRSSFFRRTAIAGKAPTGPAPSLPAAFREVKPGTDATDGQPLLDDNHMPIAQVNKDGTPGKPGEVRLKLVFMPEIAGTLPFHCHVLFHEDNGMMGTIRIVP